MATRIQNPRSPTHLAHASNSPPHNLDPLRREPPTLKPPPQAHLPLLRSPLHARGTNTIQQRPARPPLCSFLHHLPDLHPRIHHATPPTPSRAALPHKHALQAIALHGAILHSLILRPPRTHRPLSHEPHTRLVFQHSRDVRGLSA